METSNTENKEPQEVQEVEKENEDIINFQIKLPEGKSLKVQVMFFQIFFKHQMFTDASRIG